MEFKQNKKNEATFTFEITKEQFNEAIDQAYKTVAKDVEVKGFRKGQVPQNIFEKHYGVERLYPDALDIIIQIKFDEAITSNKTQIVAEPTKVDFEPKQLDRNKGFKLTMVIPTKPEVELGQYKGVEVESVEKSDSKARVEQKLEQLVNSNTTLEPKQGKLEKGDTSIFDFEGFKDGKPFEGGKAENYELEIGSNGFIPGFEDQMIGMEVNEERDLNLEFPKEYHEKSLAGKPVVFKVKLNEVKVKKTPELNDEFAKNTEYGVNTLKELKEKVQKEVNEQIEKEFKDQMLTKLVTKIASDSKIELHEEMIKREAKSQRETFEQQIKGYGLEFNQYLQMMGKKEEDIQKEFNEQAEKRLREILTLEKIGQVENFVVTNEEIDQKFQEIANYYKVALNEIKKYITEEQIVAELKITKALDFIFENAKVVSAAKPKKENKKEEK